MRSKLRMTEEMTVFLAALEKPQGRARDAFLDEACADDHLLRSEVEELLRADDEPDNPLDAPPSAAVNVAAIFEAVRDVGHFGPDNAAALECPQITGSGTLIGPYKVIDQIGEGGVGLVFSASQQRPVRRLVALKIIKPGMDTKEVLARFEAERQALALMDHQNIARVFDAGMTNNGRPYFVMELVRGIPVTAFCDQNRLNVRERLHVFLDVCRAVQHAHQKGIIHRDLKPTNVLVAFDDSSVPVPKVIDFGIAKAVGQRLGEQTVYTSLIHMVGTPLYMSPEQAEMSGLDVDTRSDIYSLGVLLFELLTGSTPYDRERMRNAGLDEVRRMVREEELPPPSTQLTKLGQTLVSVSERRRTESEKLLSLVRGDLDWIVLKAMEKQPSRRYETAAALAADVRRFLEEEPVEARPPSALYRLGKFARRNRLVLMTLAFVAAVLVIGTGVSVWEAIRANEARADADRLRIKAEDVANRLTTANALIVTARNHEDDEEWAAAYADYTKAAELQPEHYVIWSSRGSMLTRLGLWKLAAADYGKALDLGQNTSGPGWDAVPQLLLYCGDQVHYRKACAQLIRQIDKAAERGLTFPDTRSPHDPTVLVIRSCSFSPAPAGDPVELARRAELLLDEHPSGISRPAPGFGRRAAYYYYVAGLAHYRAGQDEQAINRLNDTLADRNWASRLIAYPVLAMALQRSGRTREARAALKSAEVAMDRWSEQMLQARLGTLPVAREDWIECLYLYREAMTKITGAPPAVEDERLRALESRALAALKL